MCVRHHLGHLCLFRMAWAPSFRTEKLSAHNTDLREETGPREHSSWDRTTLHTLLAASASALGPTVFPKAPSYHVPAACKPPEVRAPTTPMVPPPGKPCPSSGDGGPLCQGERKRANHQVGATRTVTYYKSRDTHGTAHAAVPIRRETFIID